MKFSYSLLKKLVPEIKNQKDLAEKLTMGLFEVDSVDGDSIDVKIMPNRYSDASSHLGLAREISAFYGKSFSAPKEILINTSIKRRVPVSVETKICKRMIARCFQDIKINSSPKWMQDVLVSCGMRPINNLVDITNYVTLETGQPLHAFDLDKMSGDKLIIRNAKNNEAVELLDGVKVILDSSSAVLSDEKNALDVAGIKGGKKAEIDNNTKNILLTAGSFDGVSIYKTSKKINITTDASIRFSHNISPELANIGIIRAAELVAQLCGGSAGYQVDTSSSRLKKQIIKFDINKLNNLLGTQISKSEALKYLKLLGFGIKGDFIEVPILRTDITIFEDLVEEVARLYGYGNIPDVPPHVALHPSGFEDQIVFKDRIKKILLGFGFDEVYNTSFVDMGVFEIANPISQSKNYLRTSLTPLLLKNVEDNLRFFDKIKIFEIGKVFGGGDDFEKLNLGVAIHNNKKETFFELKGIFEFLFKSFGITDFSIIEVDPKINQGVRIEADGKIIGYFERTSDGTSVGEINLDYLLKIAEEENEFKPLSKYPSMERDISFLVSESARIGDLIQEVQLLNTELIEDVDLVDEYIDKKWKDRQSITFRIVFHSDKRTLTSEEVDYEMEKIKRLLKDKFGAEIR